MPTKTLPRPAPAPALEDVFSGLIVAEPKRPRPPREDKPAAPKPEVSPTSVVEHLARLGSAGRLAAYRAGKLDRHQRSVWAARYPDEPPLVNGELEWIALSLADLD